jgi:DNA gyrase/topoisomerase IV subunit A
MADWLRFMGGICNLSVVTRNVASSGGDQLMNLEQIEEWIHEVEQRPTSAPLIIQYVARRLSDLTMRNEDLLAENIALRTGRKVDEYESRIANLEYQLELLKRQMGGFTPAQMMEVGAELINIILFDHTGRVLRLEVGSDRLEPGKSVVRVLDGAATETMPPRLLVTSQAEELLFVFDSGRVTAMPVKSIPSYATADLSWKKAFVVEPRAGEELAAVLPIGKMTLYDYCIQVSRRGCAKRIMKTSFESHLANHYIGTGTKMKSDKTCCLFFAGKEEQVTLATKEGYLLTTAVSDLPYTTEEAMRLSVTDHVVTGFHTGDKSSVIFVTQNGKVIHREMAWLNKAESSRSRGQTVFSQARRDAGVRIVGAAAVDAEDWGMVLRADGELFCNQASSLFASGTFEFEEEPSDLVAFASFRLGSADNQGK